MRADAALAKRDVEQAQVLIEQQYSAGRGATGMKSSLTNKAKKRVTGYFEEENFVGIEDALGRPDAAGALEERRRPQF